MAGVLRIWMLADLLFFPTRLLARLSIRVLTLARSVALLATEVRTALEFLTAYLAAPNIRKPTLLVLEVLLATHASLVDQERTSWAILAIHVTVVLDLRVTTCFGAATLEATWRRLCAAREGWCQDSTATVTVDLIKDGFST